MLQNVSIPNKTNVIHTGRTQRNTYFLVYCLNNYINAYFIVCIELLRYTYSRNWIQYNLTSIIQIANNMKYKMYMMQTEKVLYRWIF